MEKIYFEGKIVNYDIKIMTNDLNGIGKNKSLMVHDNISFETISYNAIKTFSLEKISHYYLREVVGIRGLTNSEFVSEFTKVLGEAIDEFNKDVEYDNSLDFIIVIIIIRPIERFFDWLKK